MTEAVINFTINGNPIPINSFDITGGSHGSAGSAQFNTSIKMLLSLGIDIVGDSLAASSPLPVSCDVETNTDRGLLFVGEYMTGKWSYMADTVMFHCRDLGGKLVDEKRVLAPGQSSGGVNTTNQTVTQYVNQIAAAYGLTPQVNVSDDSQIGRLFGDTSNTILTSIPKTYWATLTKLARDTGNEMFVTPQGALVFGAEGQGAMLNLSWNQNPPDGSSLPLLTLDVEHNPARNASHTVTVNSYDHTKGQVAKGQKVKGSSSQRYTFHTDGMTQDQAQKRAESISKDISKRELIVTGQVDFIPSVQALQPVMLTGQVDPTFAGYPLYVNQFSHTFKMTRGKPDLATTLTLLKQGDK